MSTNQLQANGERFWDTIEASAEIGPGIAGGLRRLALTDADKEVRDTFRRWCEEAGCTVTVDRMGSMFARRPALTWKYIRQIEEAESAGA